MSDARHPSTLADLLGAKAGKFAKIQQKSRQLQEINQIVTQQIMPGSDQLCRVANFRQGMLVIEVASGAWATRFKANRAGILTQLRQHLPTLASIDIQINPGLFVSHQVEPKANPRHISTATAEHLQTLADSAPKELAEKLQRLANLARRR